MSNNFPISRTATCANCGERIDFDKEWFHHATNKATCAAQYATPRYETEKEVGIAVALRGTGQQL